MKKKPKRRRGRPTKLTAALSTRVAKLVATGVYFETAAAYAGVSKSTLYGWLKRGAEEAEGLYADFRADLDQAVAQAEVKDWEKIGAAASEDWKAAAWRLSRRFPEKFAQRSAVHVSDSPSLLKSADADISQMSVDDLEAIERIHLKYAGATVGEDEFDIEPTSEVPSA